MFILWQLIDNMESKMKGTCVEVSWLKLILIKQIIFCFEFNCMMEFIPTV